MKVYYPKKDIENDLSFSIPLIFPDGIKAYCNFLDRKKGASQISCQVDRSIEDSIVVFEKTTPKDGAEEILNLGGFSSKEIISCSNGLLLATQEKIENVKVSFRQVSHLSKMELMDLRSSLLHLLIRI